MSEGGVRRYSAPRILEHRCRLEPILPGREDAAFLVIDCRGILCGFFNLFQLILGLIQLAFMYADLDQPQPQWSVVRKSRDTVSYCFLRIGPTLQPHLERRQRDEHVPSETP